MAEQTVDEIVTSLKRLHEVQRDFGRCRTAEELLLPKNETEGISGILPPEPSRALVEHFCGHEWTLHLDDLMIRRSGWHYYRRDARALAGQVAEWMLELLGWSDGQCANEMDRYIGLTNARKQTNYAQTAAHAVSSRDH
jgi:glycerol-3-phosphate dehydrogenase